MKKLIVFLLVLVVLSACVASNTDTSRSVPSKSRGLRVLAYYACLMFVERDYDISGLDAKEYDAGEVLFDGSFYGMIVLYPREKLGFGCKVVKATDGWILSRLEPFAIP